MNKQGPKGIDYLRGGYTWNPFTGCFNGCPYCWAKRTYDRFHLDFTPQFHPEKLEEPLRVKKPSLIGVTFSGDMWGDWYKGDPEKRAEQSAQIQQVLDVCREASWHRFLFLTKNPSRYSEFDIPENCWCGTSITGGTYGVLAEEQRRVMDLEHTLNAKHTWLSIEPWWGYSGEPSRARVLGSFLLNVDWVVIGGMTGKEKRMPPVSHLADLVERAGLCHSRCVFVKSNAGIGPQEFPEGLRL